VDFTDCSGGPRTGAQHRVVEFSAIEALLADMKLEALHPQWNNAVG